MKTLKSTIAIIILYIISIQLSAQNSFPAEYNRQIPKKLTFQVKIILNSNETLPPKILDMFQNNLLKQADGNNVYLMGEFRNEKQAQTYLNALSKFGYNNAEVIAFFRQRQISMRDATTLAHNYNRYDDESLAANKNKNNTENLAEVLTK